MKHNYKNNLEANMYLMHFNPLQTGLPEGPLPPPPPYPL